MRLPQPQLESICFVFEQVEELIVALGEQTSADETDEVRRLFETQLPPVTSPEVLSVMLGYNLGFIWSLLNSTHRYYRHFQLRKGAGYRDIEAPRVALKAIQKWLSYHFQIVWEPNEHVFGFVPGRSHIGAAAKHLLADWVYSIDIEDFFPSISVQRVREALRFIGYRTDESLEILARLCCLDNRLVQGAPTSPVLSNIVLRDVDQQLVAVAERSGCIFTRYADDIVFSGRGSVPHDVLAEVKSAVSQNGWAVSRNKERLLELPGRLKFHGLLVHGERLRLTKGYRNRVRAYQHLLNSGKVKLNDLSKVKGHLSYASQVNEFEYSRS